MEIIDKVIDIGKKFLPDKDKQLEYEIEMRKLDLEDFKEKKGIITKIFHLVFPFAVFVFLGMIVIEFWIKINYLLEKDIWLLQNFIPKSLELFVLIFISLLMPKKLLEPIVTIAIKYFENKFKK